MSTAMSTAMSIYYRFIDRGPTDTKKWYPAFFVSTDGFNFESIEYKIFDVVYKERTDEFIEAFKKHQMWDKLNAFNPRTD